jgi:hypothetical protein
MVGEAVGVGEVVDVGGFVGVFVSVPVGDGRLVGVWLGVRVGLARVVGVLTGWEGRAGTVHPDRINRDANEKRAHWMRSRGVKSKKC